MKYQDRTFESAAIERMESCDLFDYDAFVVTIKTQRRNYGKISQQFCLRYPKMRLPDLGWGVILCYSSRNPCEHGCGYMYELPEK